MSMKGGRGYASIEDHIKALRQGLGDYIRKSKERLITAESNIIDNIGPNRKQQKLENRNGKKSNCMDTLSDNLAILHMRYFGQGYESNTKREIEFFSFSSTKSCHKDQLC